MNELRKIEKSVNKYVKLLALNPENIKMYSENYAKDIENLQTTIEDYINTTSELFQKWCNISVSIFSYEDSTVFLKIRKNINMIVANHYLSRFSYKLSRAGILLNNVKIVKERIMQYNFLT